MSKLPRLTGKEVIHSLERNGFQLISIRDPDGRRTVVPVHGNDTLGLGLLSKIIRDCGVEFSESGNEPNRE